MANQNDLDQHDRYAEIIHRKIINEMDDCNRHAAFAAKLDYGLKILGFPEDGIKAVRFSYCVTFTRPDGKVDEDPIPVDLFLPIDSEFGGVDEFKCEYINDVFVVI